MMIGYEGRIGIVLGAMLFILAATSYQLQGQTPGSFYSGISEFSFFAPEAEICGDYIDNDIDLAVDEGCDNAELAGDSPVYVPHTFSAFALRTPVIDGKDTGDWNDADSYTAGIENAGTMHNLTVKVKNDMEYLYILVNIDEVQYPTCLQPPVAFITLLFDNNDNHQLEQGENAASIRHDGGLVNDWDLVNPDGVAHHLYRDTFFGGTNDIMAAITHSNPDQCAEGSYIAEFRLKLNSEDDANDFSLSPGKRAGFSVHYSDANLDLYWPYTVPYGGLGWSPIQITPKTSASIDIM